MTDHELLTSDRVMIIASESDGLNTRIVPIELRVSKSVTDLMGAVRNACTEYCKTEEGKKTYIYNCNNFNWGDFAANVPNSICKKYGFIKCDEPSETCDVDFNEQLVNKFDIVDNND